LQVYTPQPFSGSVPTVRLRQVPIEPDTLQALHGPEHELLQHTPSTQLPEEHWHALLQVAASERSGTHAEPEQYALVLQAEEQTPPEQVV
jgi:hypothetical protein